jgi:hypothetical protein
MTTTTIHIECSAKTNTGRFVTLPEGTEIQASPREIMDLLNGQASNDIRLMARCPRAKNPAPYEIDASDLRLAVDRYF